MVILMPISVASIRRARLAKRIAVGVGPVDRAHAVAVVRLRFIPRSTMGRRAVRVRRIAYRLRRLIPLTAGVRVISAHLCGIAHSINSVRIAVCVVAGLQIRTADAVREGRSGNQDGCRQKDFFHYSSLSLVMAPESRTLFV